MASDAGRRTVFGKVSAQTNCAFAIGFVSALCLLREIGVCARGGDRGRKVCADGRRCAEGAEGRTDYFVFAQGGYECGDARTVFGAVGVEVLYARRFDDQKTKDFAAAEPSEGGF